MNLLISISIKGKVLVNALIITQGSLAGQDIEKELQCQ